MQKKLPIILIIVAVFAIAGGAYFSSQKKQSEMAGNNEQKAAVQEILSDCKYDKDFCAYMAAQAKSMSSGVIITTSSEVKNFGLSTSEMKIDGSENMEINSYKDGKLESSMIVFEKITYIKDTDGSWYSLNTPNPQDNEYNQGTMEEIKNTYSEENLDMQVKKVATEACGNLICDKYEIINVIGEQSSTMYTWIDTKEHLARKMEFTFEGGSSTMEYKYESVKIVKPSPIKKMPSLGTGVGAPGSVSGSDGEKMPSQEELEQMMKDYSLDGQ
jgi:hypothetical protein